jgi:hypothetical protein
MGAARCIIARRFLQDVGGHGRRRKVECKSGRCDGPWPGHYVGSGKGDRRHTRHDLGRDICKEVAGVNRKTEPFLTAFLHQILPGPLNYLESDCIPLSGVERRSIEPDALNSLDFSRGQGFESLTAQIFHLQGMTEPLQRELPCALTM